MATRESRDFKTGPRPKQRKSKITDDYQFPREEERLPLHIPRACNVAMGDGEEIVTWLRRVPRNTQAILILFPNEASYRSTVRSSGMW